MELMLKPPFTKTPRGSCENQAIPLIDTVEVNSYGATTTSVCSNTGVSHAITFSYNPGNLPDMSVFQTETHKLSSTSISADAIEVYMSEGSGYGRHGGRAQDGTRELVECSGHGACDRTTGKLNRCSTDRNTSGTDCYCLIGYRALLLLYGVPVKR